jgi:hypothetical protein
MSNVLQFTTKAELTKLELDALINKDRQVFRIPEGRGSREDFFSVKLGKDAIPESWVLPDDLAIEVGKHSESAKGAHLDKYHVIYTYTFWKDITNVDIYEYLKDYSSKIVQYVVDLDSDIQGTHFLDIPRTPYYVYASVYIDGKEIEYNSNEQVMENLMFYQSMERLSVGCGE